MNLYMSNEYTGESGLACYIYIKDNRVYGLSKDDAPNSESALLYDFGLQPGESAYVCSVPKAGLGIDRLKGSYVKCVSVENLTSCGKTYRVLNLEEYGSEDGVTCFLGNGRWVVGIGSMYGMGWNTGFEALGEMQTLETVYCDGHTVFEIAPAGVHSVDVETQENDVVYGLDGLQRRNGQKGIMIRNGRKELGIQTSF